MLLTVRVYDEKMEAWEKLLGISEHYHKKRADGIIYPLEINIQQEKNYFEIQFSKYSSQTAAGTNINESQFLAGLASKSFYAFFRSIFIDNAEVDLYNWECLAEVEYSALPAKNETEVTFIKKFVINLGYEISINESDVSPLCKLVQLKKRSSLKHFITQVYAFLQFAEGIITPHQIRHGLIAHELFLSDYCNLIELGCGEGEFIFNKFQTFSTGTVNKITGVEIDTELFNRGIEWKKNVPFSDKIELINADICVFDERFNGYDTVALIEVIEHLHEEQLLKLESVVFEYINPENILISTPNSDYNIYCTNLLDNGYRHPDHKFEWNKKKFLQWATSLCTKYNYALEYFPIGLIAQNNSAMSQLIRFKKCNKSVPDYAYD
jgi:2-polyprenyl-3-methyl-5-hydroxy-6-metoxy-1,4-benzoquinol methylase